MTRRPAPQPSPWPWIMFAALLIVGVIGFGWATSIPSAPASIRIDPALGSDSPADLTQAAAMAQDASLRATEWATLTAPSPTPTATATPHATATPQPSNADRWGYCVDRKPGDWCVPPQTIETPTPVPICDLTWQTRPALCQWPGTKGETGARQETS